MDVPVEQISEDDVIIGQQQRDREQYLDDMRPASFGEYLRIVGGDKPASPQERHRAVFESLTELADKARRAPRDG